MKFFGEPWPSGVCEEGTQIATPIGERCTTCKEPIAHGDRGTREIVIIHRNDEADLAFRSSCYSHRECSLRAVLGGIGHHIDHDFWCLDRKDPDGTVSLRTSALLVWQVSNPSVSIPVPLALATTRLMAHRSIDEVAEFLSIAPADVEQMERGTQKIGDDQANALADWYHL